MSVTIKHRNIEKCRNFSLLRRKLLVLPYKRVKDRKLKAADIVACAQQERRPIARRAPCMTVGGNVLWKETGSAVAKTIPRVDCRIGHATGYFMLLYFAGYSVTQV